MTPATGAPRSGRGPRRPAAGVFITRAYAHDSAESCAREALRTRHERSPLEYRGYHHTMLTAADPSHFRRLILEQGGWSPPPRGRPLGLAPRLLPPSIVSALRRDCERSRASLSGSAPPRSLDDVVRAVSAHMSEHKRGIFVSIRGGRVASYQPFSLFRYRNRSMSADAMASASADGGDRRWLQDPGTWFVNHCFLDLRPQTRINPPEWWTVEYFELLRRWERWDGVPEAAREGIHADFIINNSDYPVSRLGGPRGGCRLPVVGATRHADSADVAVPTQDDIEALTGKVFLHLSTRQACKRDSFTPENRAWVDVPWELRAPTAVFRGSANGCGTTTGDNPRLKLALVAHRVAAEAAAASTSKAPPLLDVGITDWSNWAPRRPDPVGRPSEVRRIDVAGLPFELSSAIPFRRQAAFKYIVNVEGYVAAFRYPHLLDSGSVVINVRSAYGLWFEPAVVPGEHVVEVRDPSEVPDVVPSAQGRRRGRPAHRPERAVAPPRPHPPARPRARIHDPVVYYAVGCSTITPSNCKK